MGLETLVVRQTFFPDSLYHLVDAPPLVPWVVDGRLQPLVRLALKEVTWALLGEAPPLDLAEVLWILLELSRHSIAYLGLATV